MNNTVKIALISAVTSVACALVPACATLLPQLIDVRRTAERAEVVAEYSAEKAARASLVSPCKLRDAGPLAATYDLSSSAGKLILISVSGMGEIAANGGSRAEVTAEIEIGGEIVARDKDFRSGQNLDNEVFGAGLSYSFIATEKTPSATARVTVLDPRGVMKSGAKFSALEFTIPKE